MTWRGPRTPRDPLLVTAQWRRIRKHWLRLRLPCARCGLPIDYDGPRYLVVNGRRKQNPRAFVAGHIVSRRRARALGWNDERINSIANSQPECQACSNRSGASEGARVANGKANARGVPRLPESLRW